jgi:hypothetical protein
MMKSWHYARLAVYPQSRSRTANDTFADNRTPFRALESNGKLRSFTRGRFGKFQTHRMWVASSTRWRVVRRLGPAPPRARGSSRVLTRCPPGRKGGAVIGVDMTAAMVATARKVPCLRRFLQHVPGKISWL